MAPLRANSSASRQEAAMDSVYENHSFKEHFMKVSFVGCLTLAAALQLLTTCNRDLTSTGSVELDRVINADYSEWRAIIEDRRTLLKTALKKLNPHFDAGCRQSITTMPQRIALSLLAMKKRAGVIVELGSWTGGGALLMAPYLEHEGSYHAVDTFNADTMSDEYMRNYLKGRKHLDVFNDNIAPLKRKVVVHQGQTNDIAATWPKGRAIDLLFIDADHSYAAVAADFRNWSPFVREGGIIAFHDYYSDVRKYGHPGVRKFVDELRSDPRQRIKLYSLEGLAWFSWNKRDSESSTERDLAVSKRALCRR
jgi:predicted O-methyltransferase YrrM